MNEPCGSVRVGSVLPTITFGPITRTDLARYAGASGDYNRIHIDIDFAREAGADDVFAHGMLSMAVLGRLLTGWVGQERVRVFGVRFTSITRVHSLVTCTGSVAELFEEAGERRARIELSAATQDGQTLAGWAIVALGSSCMNGESSP